MPQPERTAFFVFTIATLFVLDGCAGGSGTQTPTLVFTSTPNTSANEATQYTYQLTARSSDNSPTNFALTVSPTGAILSGNTISWTPSHTQSRVSNSFTASATTSSGGSATQSWTVTPAGIVNLTAVTTYWGPSGPTNVIPQWPTYLDLPYPAALVPQSDGSLLSLQGSANPDGSFSIPNVPPGYYWLQADRFAYFWTPTSDFDYGSDFIGNPGGSLSGPGVTSYTTFNLSVSGINPSPQPSNYIVAQPDAVNFSALTISAIPPNATTFSSQATGYSYDWSHLDSMYLSEYEPAASGNFAAYVLGPAQTISNLSVINGATNTITGRLTPSPPKSISFIATSAWASASEVGPGTTQMQGVDDFALFVQPYVSDRFGSFSGQTSQSFLVLLQPASNGIFINRPFPCFDPAVFISFGTVSPSTRPGVDQDYGPFSYGDPYPVSWPRLFQYCQSFNISLPRPNDAAHTDIFLFTNGQVTALPTDPVAPILSPVQSPTVNGGSFFQSVTLNSDSASISWTPPATGQPIGYYIEVMQLGLNGVERSSYNLVGTYATSKTSVTLPSLGAGTYVFSILAVADASANIETKPNRHKIPVAEVTVLSAPFVIPPGL